MSAGFLWISRGTVTDLQLDLYGSVEGQLLTCNLLQSQMCGLYLKERSFNVMDRRTYRNKQCG